MPGLTAAGAAPAGRARTLAQMYRRFAEVDAAGTSPLYERVAVALSESAEALRAIEAAPARRRHPTVILAALHDLALAGRAPADAGTRDRTLRRAVPGHRGGGAPGGRERCGTDRRGLFGWAQSQCRSR